METRGRLDVARCEALIGDVLQRKEGAWEALQAELCPALLGYAARSRALGHRRSDDDCLEILTATLERLSKNDFHFLRGYRLVWRAKNPDKTLEDWLRIVTANLARDYVSHRMRRSVVNTWTAALDTDAPPRLVWPGMTQLQLVREIMEHAATGLSQDQAHAVRRWVDGYSTEEIASETREAEHVVTRRLRAAFMRLRRWARTSGGTAVES